MLALELWWIPGQPASREKRRGNREGYGEDTSYHRLNANDDNDVHI